MKRCLYIIDSISSWTGKIFAFLIVIATVQITFEVVMRYFFNAPTFWGLEVTIWLCAAMYAIGGAYALLHNAHVRVDVFYIRWSPRLQAIVELITAPLFFLGVATLFWVSTQWTIKAYVDGTTSISHWEPLIWPIRGLLALGSFLLLIQGIAKYIRDFSVARKGTQ